MGAILSRLHGPRQEVLCFLAEQEAIASISPERSYGVLYAGLDETLLVH